MADAPRRRPPAGADKEKPRHKGVSSGVSPDTGAAEAVAKLWGLASLPGVDSKSISEISRLSGLGVSALARFFPEGTNRMVSTLVGDVSDWVGRNILSILASGLPPEEKIRLLYAGLERYARHSERSFLLTILALDTSNENVRQSISYTIVQWVNLVATVLEMTGLGAQQARIKAEDSMISLQGAALYSRITGNPEPLLRTLKDMPRRLLSDSLSR